MIITKRDPVCCVHNSCKNEALIDLRKVRDYIVEDLDPNPFNVCSECYRHLIYMKDVNVQRYRYLRELGVEAPSSLSDLKDMLGVV